MSTPTPETDAAIAECGVNGPQKELHGNFAARLNLMIEHARLMEQQRDAARKDADDLAEALDCFRDVGLCKAFHDMMRSSLASHRRLCKLENRQA